MDETLPGGMELEKPTAGSLQIKAGDAWSLYMTSPDFPQSQLPRAEVVLRNPATYSEQEVQKLTGEELEAWDKIDRQASALVQRLDPGRRIPSRTTGLGMLQDLVQERTGGLDAMDVGAIAGIVAESSRLFGAAELDSQQNKYFANNAQAALDSVQHLQGEAGQ